MVLSDYLSLFPGATREKEHFMALAEAVLRQAADLASLTAHLQSGFSFASAEGQQLDDLAAAVGLSREDFSVGGASDEDFREYLLAKLALWTWDGTNGTLRETLDREGITYSMTDNQDGTVSLFATGYAPPGPVLPVAAGIRLAETPLSGGE